MNMKDLVIKCTILCKYCFVAECFELYYSRQILNVAHNRFEHRFSIGFERLTAVVSVSQIEQLNEANGTYLVNSQTEREACT